MQRNRKRMTSFLAGLRIRLGLLKWLIPTGLVLLVIAYEFGLAYRIYDSLGFPFHLLADVLIFGTVGPVLTFAALHFLERWLEERETSDLQAQILARTREDAENGRQLNDDALQVLFAAGALISVLKSSHANLPPEAVAQLQKTDEMLDRTTQQLRSRLLDELSRFS
jgi:hypothetical protein